MSHDLITLLRREVIEALRTTRLDDAEVLLERLEREDPLAVETRGFRLEWLVLRDRLEDAETLLEQLLALHPDSPRIHFLAGRLAYKKKEYARAVHHFQESQLRHPSWWTRFWQGDALTQLGQFEEAEAVLLEVVPHITRARRTLAWLYQRRDDPARALAELKRYLELVPEDEYAKRQALTLEARLADPVDLVDEVEGMLELGEDVAPDLVPEYCRTLFATGAADKARAFLEERGAKLEPRIKVRIAWDAYKAQLHDVATRLFLEVFASNRRYPKFLTALEAAAKRAGKLARVLEIYREHAPESKNLYGRIARLERQLDT